MDMITRQEAIELEKSRLEAEIEKAKKDYSKGLGVVLYHLSDYLFDYNKEAISFSIKFLEKLAETNLVDISTIDSLKKQLQAIHNPDNFRLDIEDIIKSVVDEVTDSYIFTSNCYDDDETISHRETSYRESQVNLYNFTKHL